MKKKHSIKVLKEILLADNQILGYCCRTKCPTLLDITESYSIVRRKNGKPVRVDGCALWKHNDKYIYVIQFASNDNEKISNYYIDFYHPRFFYRTNHTCSKELEEYVSEYNEYHIATRQIDEDNIIATGLDLEDMNFMKNIKLSDMNNTKPKIMSFRDKMNREFFVHFDLKDETYYTVILHYNEVCIVNLLSIVEEQV